MPARGMCDTCIPPLVCVLLDPDAGVGVDEVLVLRESEGDVGVGLARDALPMNSVEVISLGGGLRTEAGMVMEDVREGTGELKEPVIRSILNEVE